MKKIMLVLSCFLSTGILYAQDLTLDTLVSKFLKVKGQDKMAGAQTAIMTGKLTLKNKMTVPFTVTEKRPDLFRFEYDIQGTLVIYAGNDKASWMIDPRTGSSDPQDLPTKEAKENTSSNLDPYFDWDNPLVKWKENGDKMELIGKEDLKGIPVYNIKMTSKDNDWVNFLMDAEKFLILEEKYNVKINGKTLEEEQLYSDFRSVEGIILPFKMEEMVNNQRIYTFNISKYEFNIPVFDLLFRKPVIKK
jgi:outer membrane lipoprotein-sorting protein